MNAEMALPYSGNADVDFINRMIPLHRGAVDMAKVVLAFGKDAEVKKVAEDVIKTNEAEIATMQEWLKNRASRVLARMPACPCVSRGKITSRPCGAGLVSRRNKGAVTFLSEPDDDLAFSPSFFEEGHSF